MVQLISCSAGSVSAHTFRSLRRATAIERNKQTLFRLQLGKLHASWELQTLQEQLQGTSQYYEEQLSILMAKVQSLELLLALKPCETASDMKAGSNEIATQTDGDTYANSIPGEASESCCQTCNASTTTDICDISVELVPMSMVEPLLERCAERFQTHNEATARELATKLQERHDAEIDRLMKENESIVIELRAEQSKVQEQEQKSSTHATGTHKRCDEVLDWGPCFDDASSAEEDQLCVGMAVQIKALSARPELNGRWGTLVKFDVERDRWHVDLGTELGIKLFKVSNLSAFADYSTDIDDLGLGAGFDVKQPVTRRNDLGLPLCDDGGVDWMKTFPDFSHQFFDHQRQREFCCSVCGDDTSTLNGCHGYAAYSTSAGVWEEGHLINMVGDIPGDLHCLRCHAATIPCKFHARGYCARGENCAYKHERML